MSALADLLLRKPIAWVVIVLSLLLSAGAGVLAMQVERDDDLLAFLPANNPDIAAFRAINERFGGLDVALVGVESPDLFTGSFLEALKDTTRTLGERPDVAAALSITNLENVTPDEMGGIRLATLVDSIPQTPEAEAALKAQVLAQDHVVGRFVSEDGEAAVIFVFLSSQADARVAALGVQETVQGLLGERSTLYWGGAPFISGWIYDTTQADMRKLTPWAVFAVVLILVVTFRDPKGAALALLSTGMGIALAHGAMAASGTELNIVLGSMPVILFAVGSAYGIHILARYYGLRPTLGSEEALRQTLVKLGPVVLASGGTTMAGLLSFLTMDIGPMRDFGLFTAIGIGGSLFFAVTFIPAVISVSGLKGSDTPLGLGAPTAAIVAAARRHRKAGFAFGLVAAVVASAFVGRVDTRMDNAAFFTPDSPPDQAERFLRERFGGSTYAQIAVEGDIKNPDVLRQIQHIADRVRVLEGVSDVVSLSAVIGQANEAMEGVRRVPDSSAKVALLLGLLTGNRAVSQLVNDDRTECLLQVELSVDRAADVERVLAAIEAVVPEGEVRWASLAGAEATAQRAQRIAARIAAEAKAAQVPLPDAEAVATALGSLDATADPAAVEGAVAAWLAGAENVAEAPEDAPASLWADLAAALVAAGPDIDEDGIVEVAVAVAGVEPESLFAEDLMLGAGTPLAEAWAAALAAARTQVLLGALSLQLPSTDAGQRFVGRAAAAVADLDAPTEFGPGDTSTMKWTVSGQPVLYRGLSRSVEANQLQSLGLALFLVLVILSLLFRSPVVGLLATLPTVGTLLAVYGGMGALGVTLDIGTSMLASLIIGAGVDYAVHFVSAWDGDDADSAGANAAHRTAAAVWANAGMVAAGFFVLTLGDARPLQNVGGLTAAAMVVAAFSTFVGIPILARARSYRAA